MENRVRLHRQAAAIADVLVAEVTPDDLGRDTPCEGWSLADLLAHQIGQQRGFAAAVLDDDAPLATYAAMAFSPDRWCESAAEIQEAFASCDPRAHIVLRELSDTPLPFSVVVGAQLLDVVVHTWDIARSLGRDFLPPNELIRVVAEVAADLPASASGPGRAFATAIPRGEATLWEQTLLRVGRRP